MLLSAVKREIPITNIRKAHNLREKSSEGQRMYTELACAEPDRCEEDCTLEFVEERKPCTLGFAYAERRRLSGTAYQSFLEEPLSKSISEREHRGQVLFEF